jgi:hypothetical protein
MRASLFENPRFLDGSTRDGSRDSAAERRARYAASNGSVVGPLHRDIRFDLSHGIVFRKHPRRHRPQPHFVQGSRRVRSRPVRLCPGGLSVQAWMSNNTRPLLAPAPLSDGRTLRQRCVVGSVSASSTNWGARNPDAFIATLESGNPSFCDHSMERVANRRPSVQPAVPKFARTSNHRAGGLGLLRPHSQHLHYVAEPCGTFPKTGQRGYGPHFRSSSPIRVA